MKKVKVRMLVSIAGLPMPEYGLEKMIEFMRDEIVELHPELARKWIDSKLAESVNGEAERETESVVPPERAVLSTPMPKQIK